jgi:septal ring factor EnvC (AmiA/AmiB activator)
VIYLILKIFAYLICGLAIGVAAGWLWRNVQAAAREHTLERQLMDSRGRLPPLETSLRTCEERLGGLRGELRSRDETLHLRNREIDGLEHTCAELRQSLEAADQRLADAVAAERRAARADAARLAAKAASEATPRDTARVRELESALKAAVAELEETRAALEAEQRCMAGLVRERELQHAALQAMEQRLEMAREQQGAPGAEANQNRRRASAASTDRTTDTTIIDAIGK